MQSPNSYVFKFDHKISDSDSISTRFLHGTGEDEFPGGGPGPGGGSQLSPWFGVTPTVADNFAISEVHVFNPNLINTLRLGWNRFYQFQRGRDSNVDPSTIGFDTGVAANCFGTPEIDIGDSVQGRVHKPRTAKLSWWPRGDQLSDRRRFQLDPRRACVEIRIQFPSRLFRLHDRRLSRNLYIQRNPARKHYDDD